MPDAVTGRSFFPDKHWHEYSSEKKAAVLCVLVGQPGNEPLELVITRRSAKLRSHSGQLSFPGGRKDGADRFPSDTALREAFEEIGLNTELVQVQGCLSPTWSIDGSLVVPVMATALVDKKELVANEEVESILFVPWTQLQPSCAEILDFNLFGMCRKSSLFRFQDNRIWGLTAGIIYKAGFILRD